MAYNLTQSQKDLLIWLVKQTEAGNLDEEFFVFSGIGGIRKIQGYQGSEQIPNFSGSALDALLYEDLVGKSGNANFISGKGYKAVENNFDAPDTTFLRHITSLPDVTNLDTELKKRCLPSLGASKNDPSAWDTALRNAGVILEQRLHDVGKISDPNVIGRDLVNRVFGSTGTLAAKFSVPGEREGYRDLYAGVVGAFRNPYGHRLIDPKPERAGPTFMFINLLLEMLEELR